MNASASLKESPKRSPLTFFILVFALALPFWLLGALVKPLPPINLSLSAIQVVCPFTAALILRYREEKLDGVRKLLKRVFDAKRIKRPLFFVVFFLAATGEEVGWTGYATDPLQDRWGALATGLILGVVWALWHIVGWRQEHQWAWVAGQCFSTIGLRILMVWLYNNTGKSMFAVIIFHTMINVGEFSFPNYGSYYDPALAGTITAAIAVIVTCLWGPKTLTRFRFGRPEARPGDERKGDVS